MAIPYFSARLLLTALTTGLLVLRPAERKPAALPGNVVEVRAGNFYFQAPDSIPAGLTTFTLASADSGHVLLLARLGGKHSAGEVLRLAAKDSIPDWAEALGGPVATIRRKANATFDLEPGNYVLLCYFHQGSTPHSAMGMVKDLRVYPVHAARRAAPPADLTVSLVNYDFKLSRPLTSGQHLVRFVNRSDEAHEVIVMRVGKGSDDERFAWGVGMLAPHGSVLSTISLAPGTYEWSCYMSNIRGRSHASLGMRRRFVVGRSSPASHKPFSSSLRSSGAR